MISQRALQSVSLLLFIIVAYIFFDNHERALQKLENARLSNEESISNWSNYSIVVARYNEEPSWLHNLTGFPNQNIYIYNKNKNTYDPDKFQNNILLPNIGKCDHSYLSHVVRNYHNLHEYTLFITPGSAPPHWDHVSDAMKPFLKTPFDFFKYCDQTWWSYDSKVYHSPNCSAVSYFCSDYRLTKYHWRELKGNKENLNFGQWMQKYVEPNIDKYVKKDSFRLNFGGMFCYSKKNILSRSLSYYEDLLSQFDSDDSEVAHFFERAWYYIFNAHKNKRT